MHPKFHIGRGRYESLKTSRFYSATYGESKFVERNDEEKKGHGTYGALLFDNRWKQKRAEILGRDSNKCVVCGQTDNLQVHHRQYHFLKSLEQFKSPWDYENHLMITLCQSCHSRGHSKYKIPNIYL